MSLVDKLKGVRPQKKRIEPVWSGPQSDADNGGITFSLLSRFLCCRERFRILVVEGLKTEHGFNHRVEYGNMWHVCEEELAGPHPQCWPASLSGYAKKLCEEYPNQREQIEHWYNVCLVQFPLYVKHWHHNDDMKNRTPIVQERVFKISYRLPSGREVYLRGKFDSIDMVDKALWVQENKSKGDVDRSQLERQLTFDLQTMMYVTALSQDTGIDEIEEAKNSIPWKKKIPLSERSLLSISGVRYNVIRRPLSGGKGSIVRHKATKNKPEETWEHYYERLREIIAEDPDHFFMRWNSYLTTGDILKFRQRCLDPILEQLCDWWEWITTEGDHFEPKQMEYIGVPGVRVKTFNAQHWQHPFGVYNILDEGGSSDLDNYVMEGITTGLRATENLFPELT